MMNRLTKYYLRYWARFDKNMAYLSSTETIKMKILYSALKEISSEERQFLAKKYRVTKKPFIPDAELATQYGIDLKEYREKRIALETKFNPILLKYIALYQDELSKAIELEYR